MNLKQLGLRLLGGKYKGTITIIKFRILDLTKNYHLGTKSLFQKGLEVFLLGF
jgi:hypothetical protein